MSTQYYTIKSFWLALYRRTAVNLVNIIRRHGRTKFSVRRTIFAIMRTSM